MGGSDPPPGTIFSLIPLNQEALDVANNPLNSRLACDLWGNGTALSVGSVPSKSPTSLITIGRDPGNDIYVEHDSVSRVQCSFEIHPRSQAVMIWDRSNQGSTQVLHQEGSDTFPIQAWRRKVVVHKGVNTAFGIGEGDDDTPVVRFRMEWHQNFPDNNQILMKPSLSQERLSLVASRTLKSMESKGFPDPLTGEILPLRHGGPIEGAACSEFGTVSTVLDLDSGDIVALKVLKPGPQPRLKKQLKILSLIKHPNIVEHITSQGWDTPEIKFFMKIQPSGTLESFLNGHGVLEDHNMVSPNGFPHQMLQALSFLSSYNIVHRGIKPENIYYTHTLDGGYKFRLGGFGINPHGVNPFQFSGTIHYNAPELLEDKPATTKSDVWSLFVTIVWASRSKEIQKTTRNSNEVIQGLIATAETWPFTAFQAMASPDFQARASADDMIWKLFSGLGVFQQPRNHVLDNDMDLDEESPVQQTQTPNLPNEAGKEGFYPTALPPGALPGNPDGIQRLGF
ncbi:hypothetical protein FQN54_000760 [Arachnomyces sp. PD_36]|nr:hypothetical protein FQN54_000760 [Arachnomyces sp. PD_36]